MDQFRLWYFIEGTDALHCVLISKYKFVVDVKREIQALYSQDLCKDIPAGKLVLLKVDIDPSPYEDAFRDLWAPDDAERLNPTKQICEIWPGGPEERHLHICVRRPSPQPELLAAAQNLHRILWGNDLHASGILKSFGDGGGLEYLPAEEVKRLELRGLDYKEDVLLFRQEYTAAFESLHLGSPTNGEPSVIVIGHPGIGKSSFLYYLLLRRLSDKKPTALQASNHFVLFGDRVRIYSGEDDKVVIPEGTLALTGAGASKNTRSPCDAFLNAETDGNARIIQATSLALDNWGSWHREYRVSVYVMDYFPYDEIKALGNILGLNVSEFLRIYNMWGPSARNCVRFSQERFLEGVHKSIVDAAVLGFVKDFRVTRRELDRLKFSDTIFSVRPKNKSITGRPIPITQVATAHIKELILNATVDVDATERIAFCRSLRMDKSFRSLATYILKNIVLMWLITHPTLPPIPCTAAIVNPSAPTLKIPVCTEDQSMSSIRDLDMNTNTPFCLFPEPKECANVDAIVCTDKVIITVQAIVSRRHSPKLSDFEQIHAQLTVLFEDSDPVARQWCHVFVTGDEENAEALRYEPRDDLPAYLNVTIYTAVLDLDQLDPSLRSFG